jgi:hypothetical protein
MSKNTKALLKNPVYRAITKKHLKDAMLDMRIHLLMLDEGQDCSMEILTITDSIHVIAGCFEIMGKQESREFRMLKSAMSVMRECSETGFKWNRNWAITMDNAIDICSDHWSKIPSPIFQQAVDEVLG